jgi:hypothetical protein
MNIVKQGFIFSADERATWKHSHAMIPTPVALNNDVIRIYVTFCDQYGVGRPGYVDVSMQDPSQVLGCSEAPLFETGRPGTFDDNGVLICSVVCGPNGAQYLYYVGFELFQKVRYKLFTGLAIQDRGDSQFYKFSESPILDRSNDELYFRCGPFCIYEQNRFKLWYVAGSDWISSNGIEKPTYVIKYLESVDGKHWDESGLTCINIERDGEYGFGRPYVIKRNETYHMFYSIRNELTGYRLGYAQSDCGLKWCRCDHKIQLELSSSGWDSSMLCYASVFQAGDKTYLFYNGNDFGRTGFGYAELRWDE